MCDARADFEVNLRRLTVRDGADQLIDTRAKVLREPVDHEAVGREQAQHAVLFDRLQRTHPGVELLFGNLRFQQTETTVPQRRFHQRDSVYDARRFKEGAEVYRGGGGAAT